MFAILCLALALSSASIAPLPDDAPLLTDAEIDAINAAGLWVADKSLIAGKTLGDVRRPKQRRATAEIHVKEYDWGELLNYVTLASSFDSRTQWPGCINPIQDEGDCLGSWAMAASDALSDRFCTLSRQQLLLSPQFLINCESDGNGYGCDGGQMSEAWTYLYSDGVPTATCIPFVGDSGSCPGRCATGTALKLYKSTSPTQFTGTASMQAAIAQGGSIESCFQMYSDFQAYRSGVYVHSSGSLIGQECFRLIGWGQQGSTNYWIGAAYFGTGWGQSGFFYMRLDQLGSPPTGQASSPAS